MKLLGSTKSKITKNENGEIVPQLEITEEVLLVLVRSIIVLLTVIASKIQESCIHSLLINHLVNY